uniref:Jacalin-type lectin domain-containing protein n=1 Tax=Lactuca sativa TaxID=4236 RepID=A0A9R1WGA6_LACSA|nr:hypothetical protein LSAT_V11C200094280 [Lactuca sativa]
MGSRSIVSPPWFICFPVATHDNTRRGGGAKQSPIKVMFLDLLERMTIFRGVWVALLGRKRKEKAAPVADNLPCFVLYSIGFTTQDFSGTLDSSQRHGGSGGPSGGRISEVNFDVDEEITEILGTVGKTTGRYANYIVISSLCFKTTKKTCGPFGKETGTCFSVPWDEGTFAGFYGRAGFYLDGLGCYLKATI